MLTAEHHEDASSWECGLAMIALASVIASPLFVPRRCLAQAATKKRRVPPCHESRPTVPAVDSLQHSKVHNLVSALQQDSCNVSVYCLVDFVNRQFVTYMAA